MGFIISKSKFTSSLWCNKYIWLDVNKKEVKSKKDDFVLSILENGRKVGEKAKEYFNIDVDVTSFDKNGDLDLSLMIEKTKEHLKKKTKTIAEASFSTDDLFCSVDILRRNEDGTYNIYEVKSSKTDTEDKHVDDVYIMDASFQRFVLEKSGIEINKVFVVLLAKDYVLHNELNLNEYFVECDITNISFELKEKIEQQIQNIRNTLSLKEEPKSLIGENCNGCDYFEYCLRNAKKPTVFELSGLNFKTKCDLYNNNISFYDIPKVKPKLGAFARKQIEYYDKPNEAYIDKEKIKEFLKTLKYPLYSLDFETYQAVIPPFEGINTYEQIPFQYSLHIISKEDADVSENSEDIKELGFLDISGNDTRRQIAESLVKDIPLNACVIAYNKSVESGIIRKLARLFPDLAPHLLSYTYRDPSTLFKKGYYYVKDMGSKYSIKNVLPALYPNEKDMNYHNLDGSIQNGMDAMSVIGKIDKCTNEEKEELYNDLKKYCALDTFAIVKILKKLYEVTK